MNWHKIKSKSEPNSTADADSQDHSLLPRMRFVAIVSFLLPCTIPFSLLFITSSSSTTTTKSFSYSGTVLTSAKTVLISFNSFGKNSTRSWYNRIKLRPIL